MYFPVEPLMRSHAMHTLGEIRCSCHVWWIFAELIPDLIVSYILKSDRSDVMVSTKLQMIAVYKYHTRFSGIFCLV